MNEVDSPQFVSRSAFRFFSGTVISKISGMVRDVAMAFYFGTSPSIAAFLLAFRFVYLFRRLFGESLLHQGFIPHFEASRVEDPRKGALFFRDLFWSMTFFLLLFVGLGEGLLSFVKGETALLARYMLPGVFFICLFGFCTGLLQSQKSFFLPSVAPVLSNLVWILGIFSLHARAPSEAATGLALLLSLAFFLQWAVTLPRVWKYIKEHLSIKELFQVRLFGKEIRSLLGPLLLGMIGVASVQINSALDGIFARFASREGPAYLWYAIRLQQLPLSLFAIALSSALLPSLSRALERGEMSKYFSLLSYAKKKSFALIFPCVVGIFALGLPSVNLLFGRGDFSFWATKETTLCLWGYGLGLLPMALSGIYAPAFYAKKDYRTPMQGFLLSAGLNFLLNALFVFVFGWGVVSIALATSFAAYFNAQYLARKLKGPEEKTFSFRIVIASLIAGALTLGLDAALYSTGSLSLLTNEFLTFPRDAMTQAVQLLSQTAAFFGVLFLIGGKELYSSIVAQRKSTS